MTGKRFLAERDRRRKASDAAYSLYISLTIKKKSKILVNENKSSPMQTKIAKLQTFKGVNR